MGEWVDRYSDVIIPNPWTHLGGRFFNAAGTMKFYVTENLQRKKKKKLRSLSQAGGFWGLLTLLNDVYLPLARPMYRALLSAVQPSPSSQPPPPPLSSSPSAPPRKGAAASGEIPSANEKTPNSGVAAEVDTGQPPPGDGSCCASSGGGGSGGDDGSRSSSSGCSCGSGSGSESESESGGESGGASAEEDGRDRTCPVGSSSSSSPAVAGGAEMGEAGCGEGGASSFSDSSSCSSTSCGRPFDLVVLDMGSLGGLDFAQKLVR